MTGLVYKSTGSWYTVKTLNGKIIECRIKGKFRIKGIKSTNPIAVGDIVDFELETKNDEVTGIIHRIHERKNYVIRKSVNLSKQTHIIASNVDQIFLLITIDNPPTFTSFIDRFLVSAEAYSIKTILLFNKIDAYGDDTILEVKYLASIYRKIGYQCIGISAKTGKNVEKVKQLMIDNVSIFTGHSGVGKSTLINAIESGLNLKTKEISEQHQQGQHTTTFAEMFDLSFDAKIIDTPGIKGFGVVDMEKEEVGDYFPEFFELKQDCKFNNCLHIHEPKCAVKEALDVDEIAISRYRSYLQILDGEEEHYRTDNFEKE
ncbi:ribosome small subunit-dependent GTPase A [Flavobacteriaceae bacterium]|jgi:ribosome biogenesis GTPase / thiamine phosphate phosphatase|nr:ribosome small subunit-dependent GTPase A [Bacteroidota bacterium]MDA9551436.1 ribosome small subunit-dependent GTPase A [Flavobacteriaceae bacterium]MDC0957150.1 ribosome small subunit-dependent GTPase A [Flavobacteriaceae bacterium]MDC3242598.1 ribosome small subunit-dependent GTPase A [Flavobacteriaceae bacterium]MDG1379755.1 ribosome small subunit-dependent GTPase A [Flavobacteriaceae bacterium]|tara:strand:- start:160 stop:1110 length:951 start_codon:yes stop_codon:yes gene_type:complete